MINSVSGVSFGTGAMDRVSQEQLYNPGVYAQPVYVMQEPPRKKGGFFNFLGKLILTAAVVCGGAVAARKFIKPLGKDAINFGEKVAKEAKPMDKVKYHFAKATDYIEEKAVNLYQKAKGIFKKKEVE